MADASDSSGSDRSVSGSVVPEQPIEIPSATDDLPSASLFDVPSFEAPPLQVGETPVAGSPVSAAPVVQQQNPVFPQSRPTKPLLSLQRNADESGADEFERKSLADEVREDLRLLEEMDAEDMDGRRSQPRDDDEKKSSDDDRPALEDLSGDDDADDDTEATDDDGDVVDAGDSKLRYAKRPKSIAQITPAAGYDPDAESGGGCRYLCPRPGGCRELTKKERQQYQCPKEIGLPVAGALGRAFEPKRYEWVASNLHYNPLYFEDPQLERYGQTFHPLVQPFASTGRFMGQALLSPYLAAVDPPHACVTPLGYYRPGECAPRLHPALGWDTRSAFEAALFYTGAILIFP